MGWVRKTRTYLATLCCAQAAPCVFRFCGTVRFFPLPIRERTSIMRTSNRQKWCRTCETRRWNRQTQKRQLNLMRALDRELQNRRGPDRALTARTKSLETAYRMQFQGSEAFDLSRESGHSRKMYGESHFANGCLLARRMVERGVRFVQVYYGNGQPWDTHSKHDETVPKLCRDIDQPIAALLTDLKQRGMLDDTLVIWGGEFGRNTNIRKRKWTRPQSSRLLDVDGGRWCAGRNDLRRNG